MAPSKLKITVVRVFEPKDVIGEDFIKPDGKPIPKCFLRQGQEFLVKDTGEKPEGFCEHAWWVSVYKSVSILRLGGGAPDWTGQDTIYTACPDGIRPVCFKIERIRE
jgi:uncharacterized repeat protein (TIGR04076 family)